MGKNFIFDPASFLSPEYMRIGDNVYIGEMAHITAVIEIGNNVMFGPRAVIIGGNHLFAVKGKSVRFLHPKNRETYEPLRVEDEVWCGACVILLGGVVLGMGCVIGAGSVVTKPIPPYVVAAGNYCRPIRKIFDDETLFAHLIALGKTPLFAEEIVARRQTELKAWNVDTLATIDRTSTYWEFQETK